MYSLSFTQKAVEDIRTIKKSGNRPMIKKLTELLNEIREHPRSGTGQVERLKHYRNTDTWSRRLSRDYRIVYTIYEEKIEVEILSAVGHYGDK